VEGWFDESWLAPPPPITLEAGERSTLVLEIAPPRRAETEAGEYAIVVVVRSHDHPGRSARLGAQLVVLPYDAITVEVLPAAAPALTWRRRSTLLPVAVSNRGNRSTAVRLQAGDAQQRCTFEFFTPGAPGGTAVLTLRPGQTLTTPLRVVAQHLPLLGLQSQPTPFFVTASAAATPDVVQRARGAVALRPLIGPWQMASVTGLGMLVAVGMLLVSVIAFLVLRGGNGPTVVQAPASQPPQVIIVNLSQPVPASAAAPAAAPAANTHAASAPPAGGAAGLDPALPLVLPNQVTTPDGVGGAALPAQALPAQALPAQPLPAAAVSAAEGATQTYAQMFQDVALRYDMDWRMLAAQAYIESSFDSLVLSSAGAMGLDADFARHLARVGAHSRRQPIPSTATTMCWWPPPIWIFCARGWLPRVITARSGCWWPTTGGRTGSTIFCQWRRVAGVCPTRRASMPKTSCASPRRLP
jgi:membrane-bound lytic murein transglycosylase F